MAEGSKQDISQKLGIEPGMTVVILHEPNWFHYDLGDLPEGVTVHSDADEQPADLFMIFAARADEARARCNARSRSYPRTVRFVVAEENRDDWEGTRPEPPVRE